MLEVEPPLFHTRLGPRFIAQTAPSLDATLAFPPNRMRACRLELSRRLLDYGQGPLHVCGARGPRRGKACILAFPFASTGLAALSIRVGGEEGSMPVPRQPGLPQLVEGGGVHVQQQQRQHGSDSARLPHLQGAALLTRQAARLAVDAAAGSQGRREASLPEASRLARRR